MSSGAKFFRFSLKSLFFAATIVSFGFGLWVFTSQMRIQELQSLRDQGAIVRLVCNPPQLLRSIGCDNTWPLFVEPLAVEFYVTPVVGGAKLGDADVVISKEDAMVRLLEQRTEARRLGASDIFLIHIGRSSDTSDWIRFGIDNFSGSIGGNETRYQLRLATNRETGANINP